ncbi:MAG: imm11 family protein [Rhizobiaceae bacterium]
MMYYRVFFGEGAWASLLDDGEIYLAMQFIEPGFYDQDDPIKIVPEKISMYFDRREYSAIAEFPYSGTRTFVCRPDITNIFGKMFEQTCRTMNVNVENSLFNLHIVDNELDAIDWELSKYTFSGENKNVPRFKKLLLRPDFETEIDIFRLVGSPACRLQIIVSENFKRIYDENKFTGLRFAKARSLS